MAKIQELLKQLKDLGGSDLHLGSGQAPAMRRHGSLEPLPNRAPIDDQALRAMLDGLLTDRRRAEFQRTADLDFAFGLDGVARFRSNYLMQETGIAAVFRLIPEVIPSIAELALPPAIEQLCHLRGGLVLVAGPNGSGKTTTVAAIIDRINALSARHIVTVEDPVEFLHRGKKSVVSQREVGTDTESFSAALRGAVRQDAEVIFIGEMRDFETVSLALGAAEMGSLVFGTLSTTTAAKTVDRIIDVFPPDQQQQARASLSEALQAVVAQVLLRTTDGKSRVPALEVLVAAQGLASVIREGKTTMIDSLITTGRKLGMQSLDDALFELVDKGIISGADALPRAKDKRRFEAQAGDTSA